MTVILISLTQLSFVLCLMKSVLLRAHTRYFLREDLKKGFYCTFTQSRLWPFFFLSIVDSRAPCCYIKNIFSKIFVPIMISREIRMYHVKMH